MVTLGLSDGKRSERNQKERTEKKKHIKIKQIKTDLESSGAVGGMCVF